MIEIYTIKNCNYCRRAVDLLYLEGTSFNVIDVTGNTVQRAVLTERTGCKTVPQIFVKGRFIGGCSDLDQLLIEGKFKDLLKD